MTPEEVAERVAPTGFMTLEKGREMTGFLTEHRLTRALELGFAHGVSTCYIASAVAAQGGGSVVSIDLPGAELREPNAEELLERCGCRELVTLHHERTSYNWRLMKLLQADPTPRFDVCFVDGSHGWETDGFAFFLVDRLLVPGGWFIFDDLNWTYADSPTASGTPRVRAMPPEERSTPQVKKIYELLVKPHPDYDTFQVRGDWAYARKRPDALAPAAVKIETIIEASLVDRAARRLSRAVRSRIPRRFSRP